MSFKYIFALVFALVVIVTERLFRWVYYLVPFPFIDEAFHVPQAIKYCNGSFYEWDPKITTLPGLYLFSVGVHRILWFKTCTLFSLRLVNVGLASLTFVLLYRIIRRLRINQKGHSRKIVLWHALIMFTFPVAYFFTFLYYTDTLSTCMVLLMIDLHLSSKRNLASLVGVVSCIARQVNIVWVGYLLLHSFSKSVYDYLDEPSMRTSTGKQHRKKNTLAVLWSSKIPIDHLLRMAQRIIEDTYSYVAVCCLFIVFVAYNRGIVVGDRSAHEAVVHLPQLLYFFAFFLFFVFPHNLLKVSLFLKFVTKRPLASLCVAMIFAAVIHFNTHVHPYLLADNRHLSFYLWNKVLQKPLFRYLLIPAYSFGLFCIYDNIESTQYQLATWVALTIALVPQKLLEFRYFIIPFYISRFHVRSNDPKFLLAETLLNLVVNAIVLYVFSSKQFYWADFKEPQRVIW